MASRRVQHRPLNCSSCLNSGSSSMVLTSPPRSRISGDQLIFFPFLSEHSCLSSSSWISMNETSPGSHAESWVVHPYLLVCARTEFEVCIVENFCFFYTTLGYCSSQAETLCLARMKIPKLLPSDKKNWLKRWMTFHVKHIFLNGEPVS